MDLLREFLFNNRFEIETWVFLIPLFHSPFKFFRLVLQSSYGIFHHPCRRIPQSVHLIKFKHLVKQFLGLFAPVYGVFVRHPATLRIDKNIGDLLGDMIVGHDHLEVLQGWRLDQFKFGIHSLQMVEYVGYLD